MPTHNPKEHRIDPDGTIILRSKHLGEIVEVDSRRDCLVKDVQEAQKEFAEGKCPPLTPEQLMEEILS